METLTAFLAQQPLLALFLVIAGGYALGAINIKGLSLGVGAVLFSGLFIGAIAPKAQPPPLVGTLGLVMFLYGLGIQFGRQFFAGLSGKAGRKYNLLAALALATTTAVCVLELMVMDVSPATMAGLFAGAGNSSATMQAALEAAGNSDPVVGYSVAYPFGLVGAILCIYAMQIIVKPKLDAARAGMRTVEVALRSPGVIGRSLRDLLPTLPSGVNVLVVRVANENRHPEPGMILGAGDVLLLGAVDDAPLESARTMLGEDAKGRVVSDRSHMDMVRVFVSKPHLEGVRVSDLALPDGVDATITHVQRGDTELLVTSELTLEMGDRVALLTRRETFDAMRRFFGDSIRGTTEFSYVSLGLGMVLGVLLGSIPVPVPVVGSFKMGIAGGSLIMALILGKLGRTGALTWTMPLAANLTLRNFGLSVFLAQVGMSSGSPFVAELAGSGVAYLMAGACILFALALTPLLIGHYVMRLPFDDLIGIASGVTGAPAVLAYSFRAFPSDRVEICYAMIFPAATILKIIIAQLLVAAGQ